MGSPRHSHEAGSGCPGQSTTPLSPFVPFVASCADYEYLACSCKLDLSWENCSEAATEHAEAAWLISGWLLGTGLGPGGWNWDSGCLRPVPARLGGQAVCWASGHHGVQILALWLFGWVTCEGALPLWVAVSSSWTLDCVGWEPSPEMGSMISR